jgi:hypothetical protein
MKMGLTKRCSMHMSRIVLSFVCAAMLCACQPSGGAKGDRSGTNQVGEKAAAQFEFPAAFPAYIPKYPGARPFNNAGTKMNNSVFKKINGAEADFITVDSREKVKAFYKTELLKAGLIEADVQSMPILDLAVYRKADAPNERVTVIINKMLPGDTLVQIMYNNGQVEPKN